MGAGWAWWLSRQKAERELKDAKKNGLDRIVWAIHVKDSAQFPESCRGSYGQEYKDDDESAFDYISRMIQNGTAREEADTIYITLDDVALEFSVAPSHMNTVTENVIFFPGIEGIVEVRYNHFNLDYDGWIGSAAVPKKAKYAKRPYRAEYHIS